ncbi:MAG: aldo/keto reductase [Synergistaceae bacterium]|jgi:predicted aldo/keto reductase-like oxidoreductase|nr:aldo/keto reductase [Synergistaceae bacterium]
MEKRFFAGVGKEISLLGFGLMRLPKTDPAGSDIDYSVGEKMVARAFEAGINYFDTAWFYHDGKSETFAGDVLSAWPRESYCLTSKMPSWMVESPADVERIFAEQLKKCRTSYFDFYLLHNLGGENYDLALKYRVYEFLRRKKEEGVIRKLGFSMHDSAEKLQRVVDAHEWDLVQIQLNYLDWETLDAKRQYEVLAKRGIPVVVMEPVRGGALATLPQAAADLLKKVDSEASPASWALRYAASLPGVMTVLSGMSAPEQLEDNIKTMTGFRPLSEAERATLAQAAAIYRASGVIPCTACRYCMDCPAGVDIPRVFAVYNHYRYSLSSNNSAVAPFLFNSGYRSLAESERAHNCVACGQCREQCPQKIDIPTHMKEIADFAAKNFTAER